MELKKFIVMCQASVLTACATPAQNFDNVANELGFVSQYIATEQFRHKVYTAININEGQTLHVYLDGDGTPWERKRWISADPTARNPLILRLMRQDDTASVLLGRPCYYGLQSDTGCDNRYWTTHRYSKEIIHSMVLALNAWLTEHFYNEVVLIGYSGGGSIALLIADKIQKISKVVTIAANLNVQAWSDFHGYPTLINSLDPADNANPPTGIKQIHIAGKDDKISPAFIIRKFAKRWKQAEYYEFAGNDHACCWEQEWTNILDLIKR